MQDLAPAFVNDVVVDVQTHQTLDHVIIIVVNLFDQRLLAQILGLDSFDGDVIAPRVNLLYRIMERLIRCWTS